MVWRPRLKAALRTVMACSIVGTTTLYSPERVRHLLAYPAFSYVTTILIVSEATLGDTFRGLWHTLYATVQVMLTSVLGLWLVGPARFTPGLATAAVALTSFAVAVPESTHLVSKRIALGQIVIVYVGTVAQGARTHIVMHPVHVALSTGLGAVASVVALLLPYPRLACSEVQKTCRMYVDSAAERLKLYLDAFTAVDGTAAAQSISRASFSTRWGGGLLQNMKENEDGMLWERPDIQFFRRNRTNLPERFRQMELSLRGLELSLASCSSFPIRAVDQEEMRTILPHQRQVLEQKLQQAKCFAPFYAMTVPETDEKSSWKSICAVWTTPWSNEDLLALFFMFCLQLLQHPRTALLPRAKDKNQNSGMSMLKPSSKCLVFASKCSISLGLAVLFGLLYNRENGYWSGLTIAISFVTERQPIFTVANARAQGTAMGSVYGIICFFIFERFMDLRLLALLPWIVFTSFLQHSRMYGQAGGISAVIGALLILGRKNYGVPLEFAITRITEATIGLICFIVVEILFEPARAGTLASIELSQSFREARDCIKYLLLPCCHKDKDPAGSALMEFQERLDQLKVRFSAYEGYIGEAEVEPNFWFCPFPATYHKTMSESLSRTIDLLQFISLQMDTLKKLCQDAGFPCKDVMGQLEDGLEGFIERMESAFRCLEKVISVKNIAKVDKVLLKKAKLHDIEMGKSAKVTTTQSASPCLLKEEAERISSSLLDRLNGLIGQVDDHECNDEVKSQMALCLGGFGFCISKLMAETMEMQDTAKGMITIQNPSCHVDLCELSCKVDALRSLSPWARVDP
ncbi:hypothetical protein SAY86_024740 [Trapa natans]|uniref:Integral membrane bound transporter domain-containing protein n=1 Tax=Trapa natans TaxID=22666 RepID=A0AAN7MPW4_TRANT|nr:hypothetical protein SAY86_024740 [Trapa natans]